MIYDEIVIIKVFLKVGRITLLSNSDTIFLGAES